MSRARRRRAACAGDAARAGALRRQSEIRRPRRPRQGDGARLHGPRRQGHDFRSADARRTARTIGTSSSPRCGSFRRRRRTSSTPTSTATSASSAPASCRCASPATAWRRPTAPRARPIGPASCRSSSCRNCTIRPPASSSTPTTRVAPDREPTFGRDWEEPFRARRIQQFFDRPTSTAWRPPPRCRRTTSRSPRWPCCR